MQVLLELSRILYALLTLFTQRCRFSSSLVVAAFQMMHSGSHTLCKKNYRVKAAFLSHCAALGMDLVYSCILALITADEGLDLYISGQGKQSVSGSAGAASLLYMMSQRSLGCGYHLMTRPG